MAIFTFNGSSECLHANCCQPFSSKGKALFANSGRVTGTQICTFALQESGKKGRKVKKSSETRTLQNRKFPSENCEDSSGNLPAGDGGGYNTDAESFNGLMSDKTPIATATRSAVLQACIVTSGSLFAFGAVLRQASHIASMEGWATLDASTEVSFGFEMWHIELIVGLVMLITSCRYILLKTWPDFAESSEAANQQVLSSLQPLDYVIVAFLPGISEEFLFRGVLLPIFGLNWKNALVTGAIFGSLHLGSGRRYSFALWATFVGFAYGMSTIISSSVIVPMASHSVNNLIGGILWLYTSNYRSKEN